MEVQLFKIRNKTVLSNGRVVLPIYKTNSNRKFATRCPECRNWFYQIPSSIRNNKPCRGCHDLTRKSDKRVFNGVQTPEYRVWRDIKSRCLNEKCESFKNYGARGVSVCERWASSFDNFLEDMGRRPFNLEIDRVDNDKGYSPENCRWATRSTQTSNRRMKRNQHGFRGVRKDRAKFAAWIGIEGSSLYLGLFSSPEEAHLAYLLAFLAFRGQLPPEDYKK